MAPAEQEAEALSLPSWVGRLFGEDGFEWTRGRGATRLDGRAGRDFALVTVRVENAVSLDETSFRRATADAYLEIIEELARRGAGQPVRIWNFVPGILEPLGQLPYRYMVFNEGRYEAYLRHLGSADRIARRAPTASAVGHDHPVLLIHALAARGAGRAVENPRQTPAWSYSRRYGPRPPCFARATRLDQGASRWLFVGGTASVVGEDTWHTGDLEGQLEETARNIEALVDVSATAASPPYVRVYFARPDDEPTLRARVPALFGAAEVEYARAQLCRPDLLVEIEALYRGGSEQDRSAAA